MSKTNEISVAATTVECYKIRHSLGESWADITLDVHASGGRIMIASAYGSWENYWGAAGPDFRKFLAGLDIHYAANKFGCGNYFDHEGTIKMYRTRILQERRVDDITPELARQMWDETLQLNDVDDVHAFQTVMWNDCPGLMSWWDGTPDIRKIITPGFQRFWELLWPTFIAEISKPVQVMDTKNAVWRQQQMRFVEWVDSNYALVHSSVFGKKWVNKQEHKIFIHGSAEHFDSLVHKHGKSILNIYTEFLNTKPHKDSTVILPTGVDFIAMERQRQIDAEGWNPVHDAHHTDESMASAAACYAMPEHTRQKYQSLHVKYGWYPRWWPATWDISWWKPTPQDRIKELTKAGALCAAEIDRIQNQKAYEKTAGA